MLFASEPRITSHHQKQITLTVPSTMFQHAPKKPDRTTPGSDRKEVCKASETSNSVRTTPAPWEKHPGIWLVQFLDVEKCQTVKWCHGISWMKLLDFLMCFCRFTFHKQCRKTCGVFVGYNMAQSNGLFLRGVNIFLVSPPVHSVPLSLHWWILIS